MRKRAKARTVSDANKWGFGFLRIPEARPKPRELRWTVMSDRCLPLVLQDSIMELIGDITDRVKLVDHVGLMHRLPAKLIMRKNAKYRRLGISTFPGGVSFEVAYIQGKAIEYFRRAREIGFGGVEISADCIPLIPTDERIRLIESARSMDLEVFTEVGYKVVGDVFGKDGLSAQEAIKTICSDLKAGARKVTIENNELVTYVRNKDRTTLAAIVDEVGLEKLLFEVGGGGVDHPEVTRWLLEEFGPDVNIQNVESDRILHVEAMRRGLSRAVDLSFFAKPQEKLSH